MTDTRTRILDEALDLFCVNGYGGTSIRQIAAAVGIKESSLYKHFAGKAEIFSAILERCEEQDRQVRRRAGLPPRDPAAALTEITEEGLLAVARAVFAHHRDDPQEAAVRRLVTIEQYRDAQAARHHDRRMLLDPLEHLTRVFARLIADGTFRTELSPSDAALDFYAPVLVLLLLSEHQAWPAADVEAALADHVRRFRQRHLARP